MHNSKIQKSLKKILVFEKLSNCVLI